MAETLGSLADKLTIKCIREYHIRQMLKRKRAKFSKKALQNKLTLLARQKRELLKELETYLTHACSGGVPLRDEKLKLYNDPSVMNSIGAVNSIAAAFDGLARKNLELWHLEDEARRSDRSLSYTGRIKRKIDKANQQRNDFIDVIDELLYRKMKTSKKKK